MPLYVDRFVVQAFLRETDAKGNWVPIQAPDGQLVHELPQAPQMVNGFEGLKKYQRDLAKKLAAET